jgi:uncharacterized protein (DUF2342 family)
MTSTPNTRTASPSTAWTGEHLLDALAFATRWLDHHRDRVNALNVFPWRPHATPTIHPALAPSPTGSPSAR